MRLLGRTGPYGPVILLIGCAVWPASAFGEPERSASARASRLDQQPPRVSITEPVRGDHLVVSVPSVRLSGRAADNRGVIRLWWQVNGHSPVALSPAARWIASAVPLEEGTNVFMVRAADAAGLEASDHLTIIRDTVAPAVTGIEVLVDAAGIARFRWQTSEPTQCQLHVGLERPNVQLMPRGRTSGTAHEVVLDGLRRGQRYVYEVRAVDVAGHRTISPRSTFQIDVSQDVTAPVVQITFPEDGMRFGPAR